MSKTEEVIKLLQDGKSTEEIKEQTKASAGLISRCRKRLEREAEVAEEEETSDEEIDNAIQAVKIEPEERFLTNPDTPQKEEYHCMGCDHKWEASSVPRKCPNCGVEFE